MENQKGQPIIFFDGVCNLCNHFIDFVVHHDPRHHFLIASLQGATAQKILPDKMRESLASVVLYDNGHIVTESTAALKIIEKLGGTWRLAGLFLLLPERLCNILYQWVAQHRYQIFGKKNSCRLPTAQEKAHFLD